MELKWFLLASGINPRFRPFIKGSSYKGFLLSMYIWCSDCGVRIMVFGCEGQKSNFEDVQREDSGDKSTRECIPYHMCHLRLRGWHETDQHLSSTTTFKAVFADYYKHVRT